MADCRSIRALQYWDSLLDDGVAAVFGLVSGETELVALIFHAGRFTGAGAAAWLAERGFKPLHFVPNSDRIAAANFDAPLDAPIAATVSESSAIREWQW